MAYHIANLNTISPKCIGKVLDSYGNRLRGRVVFCNFVRNGISDKNAFVMDNDLGIVLVFSDKVLIAPETNKNVWIVCDLLREINDPSNELTKEQLIMLRLFL